MAYRYGLRLISKSSQMKGWETIPKYTSLISERFVDQKTKFSGKVDQYFGLPNHTFPYPPGQSNDISFKNYDEIKKNVKVINYTNLEDNKNVGEGGSHKCTWLVQFTKPGTYHMNIHQHMLLRGEPNYTTHVNECQFDIEK